MFDDMIILIHHYNVKCYVLIMPVLPYTNCNHNDCEVITLSNKIPFTFRFDEKYHAKLKVVAASKHRSMSNLIEYLCKKEIDRYEKENGEIEIDANSLGLK